MHYIQVQIVPECQVDLTFEVQSMQFTTLSNKGDIISIHKAFKKIHHPLMK